ncbi:histidine kinase dimerization/phospho-acceptor domain-containing protein [Crenobacter sp. SG2305]|uniref:histidine kinase dimerization/phospho-acceptor domain-containing protein n=1 Tax=Crenobacter oryzisoli TaxID=3056844 RepID=UPI0025AB0371|nr:histidine kinase dimerization/phospho-acceptor domain-containing protein [Crenobacter sp. SG2305]MDN0085446.1 histidine kinase dimerization/phospho-acceptor domain-containing protein [Crenobacter sp. SG2305]
MGRLFRTFFLAFCLAQLTVVLLVSGLFWLKHQAIFHAVMPPPSEAGLPPMPGPPPPHPPHFLPWEPLLAGTLVRLLFSALLARHFAAPIGRLRQACAAVASGDLHTEPGGELLRRRDELADLAHDFQGMTARIRLLMDGQRRLLHDVSHELRSPLARLQLAIDLMQQQPVRATDSLARIEREAVRMERLVGELLTLSRLEVQVDGDESETFDMAELLIDVVDDARFEAAARGQRIELLVAGGVPQAGRYLLLHRAVENVVRNALRYSPDASKVTVTQGQEEGWTRICVLDEGAGMTPC